MTTKEFKSFMDSKGYKTHVYPKEHKVVVIYDPPMATFWSIESGYHSMFSPLVTIQGTHITYSSTSPITDGIKHACEAYASTSSDEKISKKDNVAIHILLQLKKEASDNADGYIGVLNPHKGIKLDSLFSIINSKINDLRS